jgi:hypothetical protein
MPAVTTPHAPLPSDPATLCELLERLEPDDIRARLDALDRERDALMLLLRAACRKTGRLPTQVTGRPVR